MESILFAVQGGSYGRKICTQSSQFIYEEVGTGIWPKWKRFVDDVFIIWKGNEQSLADFFEEIGANKYGISLTNTVSSISLKVKGTI